MDFISAFSEEDIKMYPITKITKKVSTILTSSLFYDSTFLCNFWILSLRWSTYSSTTNLYFLYEQAR